MQKLGARLQERITRSAFFFGAVLFHLVLFLMLIGFVVWQPTPPEKEPELGSVAAEQVHAPPPLPAPPSDPSGAAAGLSVNEIRMPAPAAGSAPPAPVRPGDFTTGVIGDGISTHPLRLPTPSPGSPRNDSPVDLQAVQETVRGWTKTGKFVVPIYLAKYADGDWDCNSYLHDGKLASGCLPNLMAKVQDWSNGEIKGRDLQVVAVDSPQILSDPPPFIFFTGHRDFHLTDAEITNLRKYLQIGGCIWGDSAFAGDGSRFDVAFHREMKRVLPDADLNFEPLPADHAIFTDSRFHFEDLPRGMNERGDPIECINLGGKLAILYTPNDYSDMMTMLLLPGRNENEAQADPHDHWVADHPLFTPAKFSRDAATYYRNYEPSGVMSSYKLSMNILVHLLHRYDDELLLTP